MARSTSVLAAGPDNIDAGSGAGIFITVRDTDVDPKITPTGYVTVSGSDTPSGDPFWSYIKTLDNLGEVYTWAVDGPDGTNTHWPLSEFNAAGLIPRTDGSYVLVANNPAKYPGDAESGRISSDVATWYITVAYSGDANHDASSVQIAVNERRHGGGQ